MAERCQRKRKGDSPSEARDGSDDLSFFNNSTQHKRVKTNNKTSNKFQAFEHISADSPIGNSEPPSVDDMNENIAPDNSNSNDQLSLLERYVCDQGAKIMTLRRKINYSLKLIVMQQDRRL